MCSGCQVLSNQMSFGSKLSFAVFCRILWHFLYRCSLRAIGHLLQAVISSACERFIKAGQNAVCLSVCVCLDVNQGGTNPNRSCTWRLVILKN